MKTIRLTGATALVLILAHTGGAYALDPEAAARAFLTPAKSAGSEMTVTFGSVSADGADIVVKDVTTSAKVEGAKAGAGIVSKVRLINVTDTGNGQFAASSAVYSDMSFSMEGSFSASIPEMTMNDLKTRDASGDGVPMPVTYQSALADNISVRISDPEMTISIAQVKVNMDEFMGDLPKSGSMNVTGIDVPLDAIPPGPTSPQALGYEGNMVFNISARGQARYESSGFALDDLTISGDNIGALTLSIDMDNYPNLLNTAEPNPMEMMNVVLNSISFKYVDDSFAGRILDLQAKQSGMDRAQYTQQMSMALPFMLSAINNPDFQKMVADAAGKFLNDPGTIEINVRPEQPMSAAQIMGIAQSAPHTLPDELNVTIEAR